MAVIRHKRNLDHNFTQVPNEIFDKGLSLKATGLYVYLISKPEDWVVRVRDITNRFTDQKKSVYSGLKELIGAGYVVRTQEQQNNGQFTEVEYTAYDTPLSQKGETLKGETLKEPISNINISNIKVSNINTPAKPTASAVFSYKNFLELFNTVVCTEHRGDTKSQAQFKARVKEGNTYEDFDKAIRNAAKDSYLMGENDGGRRYLTPEYITRSDRFDYWKEGGKRIKKEEGVNYLN